MRFNKRLVASIASVGAICCAWSLSSGYVARGVGRLASNRPEIATVAFSRITKLGPDALPTLLEAAANPDRQVADPARRQIETLLANGAVLRREPSERLLLQMVQGLRKLEPKLTPSGRRWARRVGDMVLEASTRSDAAGEGLVASIEGLYSDLLKESRIRDLPALGLPIVADTSLPVLRKSLPAPTFIPTPLPNLSQDAQPIAQQPPTDTVGPLTIKRTPDPTAITSRGPIAVGPSDVLPPVSPGPAPLEEPKPFTPPDSPKATGPPGLAWRSPENDSSGSSPRKPPSAPAASPGATAMVGLPPLARQVEREQVREQLRGPQKPPSLPRHIERERLRKHLTRHIERERLRKQLNDTVPETQQTPQAVAKLLEGTEEQRLQLVEQLLDGRHPNATTHLLQLAKDKSPKVRASAISAIGSSPNRQLTEAAWRMALHDKDPHVARLANELKKLLR